MSNGQDVSFEEPQENPKHDKSTKMRGTETHPRVQDR